jgi:hypothetical protein
MKGLYQWFSRRASFFRSGTSDQRTTRTVRTEVTVQREGLTLLVGGGTGFDNCPLCGQKLDPAQAERANQVRAEQVRADQVRENQARISKKEIS